MKQEIKKGYEWYRTLTEKQQKQWGKNVLNHGKTLYYLYTQLDREDTFKDFLYGSFVFSNTPQGHDYWKNIANKNK